MGLPRLLPPVPRRRSAALAGSALPDAADAARRRPADGDRGKRPARDRVQRALRGRRGRLERNRARLRACPGARLGGAPPRLSRLGDALPPGVERRRLRDRPRALGARARDDAPVAEHAGVRRARARHRDPRPDPARQPGSPARRSGSAPRRRTVAPSPDLGRRMPRRRGAAARGLGRPQRHPLRRRHRREGRPGVGAIPEGLARRPDGRTRERRPVEATGGPHPTATSSRRSRSRASTCRSTRTSPTARTTRPCG